MKITIKILSLISALGILYFASHILDLERLFTDGIWVTFVGLLVTIVPVLIAGGSVHLIFKIEATMGILLKVFLASVLAWTWLYFGSIYLAILQFQ